MTLFFSKVLYRIRSLNLEKKKTVRLSRLKMICIHEFRDQKGAKGGKRGKKQKQ